MIEINGIAYEQIPQDKPNKTSESLSKLLMIAQAFTITDPYAPRPPKPKTFPVANLVKEFELIQLKKSNLSRSERDAVVRAFHRYYRPIE